MWRDWQQKDWTLIGTTNIRETYGGWFHVYAFTMTIGILLAIAYSFYKFRKQHLSGENLLFGAAFIVPISLLGASFFGKLNAEGIGQNAEGVGFWGLFAFWKAGMSIHGGVLFGLITGLVIFGLIGRKPRISLWSYVDAIVPNILLGQVVGRWGNLFNHEIVGAPMYAIGSIDLDFARRFDNGVIDFNELLNHGLDLPNSLIGKNTLAYSDGVVYQMMPIFLVESLALLALWVLITFIVPNIGKWFGPKPWRVEAELFHLTPLAVDASFKQKIKIYAIHYRQRRKIWDAILTNKNKPMPVAPTPVASNSKLVKRWQRGNDLIAANNPHHYWLTKVGCEGSFYFFGWNLIRFFLEMSRPTDHLFIMHDKPLSLILIGTMALIGLLGIIATQVGIPQLFRRQGWYYEQNYLYAPTPMKQSLPLKTREKSQIGTNVNRQ